MELPAVNTTDNRLNLGVIAEFGKLRLAFLVVLSSVLSYCSAPNPASVTTLLVLTAGGFLVNAASNGFNQIIERNLDKKMLRTQNRPLPSGRMNLQQAQWLALIMAVTGVFLLGYYINLITALLALAALLLYTFVYTPMKQKSPLAVFVGAFPGAVPPLLGWVAAGAPLDSRAFILFSVQFMWQFPHFWAIAWKLDEDYQRAGFRLLPTPSGRSKDSAFFILVYTLSLIPIGTLPYIFNISGTVSLYLILICGILFSWQAFKLYSTCDNKEATQLMFGSFIYLPLVQLLILADLI